LKPKIAVAYAVHDDYHFLGHSVRSFAVAGPAYAFVGQQPWNGPVGDWKRTVKVAKEAGAEVVTGEWPNERDHRIACLDWLRDKGYTHALFPDGDEIAEPLLVDSLCRIAKGRVAQRVYVTMDTYWRSPDLLIRPRERLTPLLLLELEAIEPDSTSSFNGRLFTGGRQLVLDEEFGVLHHLSYVGGDERIKRKLASTSHSHEIIPGWFEDKWLASENDPLIREFHPTFPPAYGYAVRIPRPACLGDVQSPHPVPPDPDLPAGWPTVSVVIPLYGGEEDIRLCLQSLDECSDLLREVIVVDDRSPDGAASVASGFPGVKVVLNDRNVGFAASCNRGLAESDGDVVLFLNSDTLVPRAGLIRLVETVLSEGSVGAAGPLTNNAGYGQAVFSPYSDLSHLELFARDFANRQAEDRDVPMLVGFCIAIPRRILREVGGFDERFGRGMFEDNDLSYRIQRAGYRCLVSSRAFVHHSGGRSMSRIPEPPEALLERNKVVYHAKWREDLETGFASHLAGQRAEPVTFRRDRKPERLRKELSQLARKANISLIMIVKNEERVLGDCLKSVQGFFAQIVVVDTGSSDRTVEIAREWGAEVHEIAWPDSFAEARNESLRHATGTWALFLDADDTLPLTSAETVLRSVASAPRDVIGFVMPVQFVDSGPNAGVRVDHVKLFRNLPGLAFEGRIHEQIMGSLRQRGGEILRLDAAVVLHTGYDTSPEGQARKRARDEPLLQLDLADRPDHPFPMFNMGMTRHYNGQHAEAVEWLRRSIAAAGPSESHVRKAYALLGVSYREMGDLDQALKAFAEGLQLVGEDPELMFQAGIVLTELGRYREASQYYLGMPTNLDGHFSSVDIGILGPKRAHNLGSVYLELNLFNEAREQFRSAVAQGFFPSALSLFGAAVDRRDFKTAEEALDMIRGLDGHNETWASGLARLAEVRGEDPLAALSEAHRSQPSSMGIQLVLARKLLEIGALDQALLLFERLNWAGNAEAAYHLGVFASRDGDFEWAHAHMKRAQALNPGHAPTQDQVSALETALEQDASALRSKLIDPSVLVGPHVGSLGPGKWPYSVVVVTYMSAGTIGRCLESLHDAKPPDTELILVDNASTDATAEIVSDFASRNPSLIFIRNKKNVGYAKAANQGIRKSSGEFVVLLNPDTELGPGSFESMRLRLTDGVAAVGPVTNTVAGDQHVSLYLPSGYRPDVSALADLLSHSMKDMTKRTRFLAGFCLMLPQAILNKHGLLDERMELGADDLELSWRLTALGYSLAVAGDAFVRHEGAVSFGSLPPHEREGRVFGSDRALVEKLGAAYGKGLAPSSREIWGCDIFSDASNRESTD